MMELALVGVFTVFCIFVYKVFVQDPRIQNDYYLLKDDYKTLNEEHQRLTVKYRLLLNKK